MARRVWLGEKRRCVWALSTDEKRKTRTEWMDVNPNIDVYFFLLLFFSLLRALYFSSARLHRQRTSVFVSFFFFLHLLRSEEWRRQKKSPPTRCFSFYFFASCSHLNRKRKKAPFFYYARNEGWREIFDLIFLEIEENERENLEEFWKKYLIRIVSFSYKGRRLFSEQGSRQRRMQLEKEKKRVCVFSTLWQWNGCFLERNVIETNGWSAWNVKIDGRIWMTHRLSTKNLLEIKLLKKY